LGRPLADALCTSNHSGDITENVSVLPCCH
jgi:hypothetical protein